MALSEFGIQRGHHSVATATGQRVVGRDLKFMQMLWSLQLSQKTSIQVSVSRPRRHWDICNLIHSQITQYTQTRWVSIPQARQGWSNNHPASIGHSTRPAYANLLRSRQSSGYVSTRRITLLQDHTDHKILSLILANILLHTTTSVDRLNRMKSEVS